MKKLSLILFATILTISITACGSVATPTPALTETKLKNDIQDYCWYDRDSGFLYIFRDDEYFFAALSEQGSNNITLTGSYDIKENTIILHSDIGDDITLNDVTVEDDRMFFVSDTGHTFELDKLPAEIVKELLE